MGAHIHMHRNTPQTRRAKPTVAWEGEDLSSGLHQSRCVSQRPPPNITSTEVKMQIPRPRPRPGILHFQQASQLILMHTEV